MRAQPARVWRRGCRKDSRDCLRDLELAAIDLHSRVSGPNRKRRLDGQGARAGLPDDP